ncbi:hypothetical protein ACTWPB_19165 [Nocardia sp. IBHARD005]
MQTVDNATAATEAAVPGLYISEHQWHLATEFGNWIEAYLR